MDYEQKYKEILEWARKNKARLNGVSIEDVLPELKESEDERILASIADCVGLMGEDGNVFSNHNVTKVQVLSWLENQKEQKPLDNVSKEEYVKRFKTLCDAYEIKLPNREYDIYHLCDDLSKLSIDSGKQKPIEKEIILTSFEETLNTLLFDFAHSPIEDCEPKEFIKKHSAEILKAAYKELNAQLKQDFFEAQQEGRREGYEAAKAEQKPVSYSPLCNTIKDKIREYVANHFIADTVPIGLALEAPEGMY